MTYDVIQGLRTNMNISWFSGVILVQVYQAILNTYHWRAIDADHVVVWQDGILLGALRTESVIGADRETTIEEAFIWSKAYNAGRSRGYNPGPLVVDPKGGVNSSTLSCTCNGGEGSD